MLLYPCHHIIIIHQFQFERPIVRSNLAGKHTVSNSNLNSISIAMPSPPPPEPKRPRRAAAQSPLPTDIEEFSPTQSTAIRSFLLRWYDANRRDLPWRRSSSSDEEQRAYEVWVSEVMLQQTRVAAVVGYFDRWMSRWPTLRDLAQASQEEVNEMWAGLGYYRRARFLLEGAKSIVQEGMFPRTAAALRGVRGIGEYTAGAIASIAFNEVVPVVDGNVVRVISRLKAISANPREATTVKRFWKLAGQLVDPHRPGDLNQAIMELGATLCMPTSPSCSLCPVAEQCCALLLTRNNVESKVTDYPAKVVKTKQRNDYAAICVVEMADLEKHMFLLVKRPEDGLLAGLWEFPSVLLEEEKTDQDTRRKAIDEYLKSGFGVDVNNCNINLRRDVGQYVHVFSHIRLHMYVELLILVQKDSLDLKHCKENDVKFKYVAESSMKSLGLSSGVRKVYDMIEDFKQNGVSQKPKRPRKRK